MLKLNAFRLSSSSEAFINTHKTFPYANTQIKHSGDQSYLNTIGNARKSYHPELLNGFFSSLQLLLTLMQCLHKLYRIVCKYLNRLRNIREEGPRKLYGHGTPQCSPYLTSQRYVTFGPH